MWAFLKGRSLVFCLTASCFSCETSFIPRLHFSPLCTWFPSSSPTITSLLSSRLHFLWPVRHFHLDILQTVSACSRIHVCWNLPPLLTSLFLFIILPVAHAQNSGVIFDSLSSLGPQSNQAASLIHSFLTMSLAAVPSHFCCHFAHLHPYQLTQDYYNSLTNLTAS